MEQDKGLDSTEEDNENENEKKICTIIIKAKGPNCGNVCGKAAKTTDGRCGNHRVRHSKKDGDSVSVGTSKERKLDVIALENKVYVCNVKGTSGDTGAWRPFWIKHTKKEYPKKCQAKDCELVANRTGHMYLRDEYEAAAKTGTLPKHNYLVPICPHHNSSVYDTKFFLVKKTTVAVKILENKNIR